MPMPQLPICTIRIGCWLNCVMSLKRWVGQWIGGIGHVILLLNGNGRPISLPGTKAGRESLGGKQQGTCKSVRKAYIGYCWVLCILPGARGLGKPPPAVLRQCHASCQELLSWQNCPDWFRFCLQVSCCRLCPIFTVCRDQADLPHPVSPTTPMHRGPLLDNFQGNPASFPFIRWEETIGGYVSSFQDSAYACFDGCPIANIVSNKLVQCRRK